MPLTSAQTPSCELPSAPVTAATLSQAAVIALWHGQVIEAVKLVRIEQNIGLKEAKARVDAYVQTQPALMNRIDQARSDTREGVLRWLIFLLVGGAGLAYLLM